MLRKLRLRTRDMGTIKAHCEGAEKQAHKTGEDAPGSEHFTFWRRSTCLTALRDAHVVAANDGYRCYRAPNGGTSGHSNVCPRMTPIDGTIVSNRALRAVAIECETHAGNLPRFDHGPDSRHRFRNCTGVRTGMPS